MSRVTFWLGDRLQDGSKLPLLQYPVQLFDSEYEVSWLNTTLGKYIIKAVDESDHIKDRLIESPVLGGIPPSDLSSGCKGVLLAAFHPDIADLYMDGSKMGDNCYPVLFHVAKETGRDVKVRVGRLLRDPWGEDEEVLFMPLGYRVKGYTEAFNYLASHTKMFYKGERYGDQG